jgi:lipoate-protein ligase A
MLGARSPLLVHLQRRTLQVRIVKSSTTNPFFNLATEEWLYRSFTDDQSVLYLWRNEPTVFIGRNQNPWRECHMQRMLDDNVHLVRRYSGGGAVYQVSSIVNALNTLTHSLTHSMHRI